MGKVVLLVIVVFVAILGLSDAGKKGGKGKCEGKKFEKMVKAHGKCLTAGFPSKLGGCKAGDGKATKKVLRRCKKVEKRLKKCEYQCTVPTVCEGGMVFNECGSACTPTCDNPDPKCTKECVEKCECPADIPYLLDNKCISPKDCPIENVEYKVVAVTSDKTNAGTDDKIFMSLIGDDDDSEEIEVDDPNKNDRQKGQTDTHILTLANVGNIKCVQFRTDGTDGWNIKQVDISKVGDDAHKFTTGILEAWLDDKETKTFCRRSLVKYKVVLKTSDITNAATDNWIYLTISGSKGETREVGLDVAGKNDMMQGATDTHELKLLDVGDIKCAQFRIKGTDGWNVEWVEIFKDGESAYKSGKLSTWLDDNATKRFCVS